MLTKKGKKKDSINESVNQESKWSERNTGTNKRRKKIKHICNFRSEHINTYTDTALTQVIYTTGVHIQICHCRNVFMEPQCNTGHDLGTKELNESCVVNISELWPAKWNYFMVSRGLKQFC